MLWQSSLPHSTQTLRAYRAPWLYCIPVWAVGDQLCDHTCTYIHGTHLIPLVPQWVANFWGTPRLSLTALKGKLACSPHNFLGVIIAPFTICLLLGQGCYQDGIISIGPLCARLGLSIVIVLFDILFGTLFDTLHLVLHCIPAVMGGGNEKTQCVAGVEVHRYFHIWTGCVGCIYSTIPTSCPLDKSIQHFCTQFESGEWHALLCCLLCW